MDCLFCKIANKQIPSNMVYEDDFLIAFHDIAPIAPVHVLIIPKEHIPSVMQVEDNDIVNKIIKAAQKIAKEVNIDEDGFRIVNNCGEYGGQTVKHLHFHLIGGKKLGIMG